MIDHVILDILHLFLRVCDVLINLLILELRRQEDSVEKTISSRKSKRGSESVQLVTVYENYLKEVCKINFHMFQEKQSREMKWERLDWC